MFSVRTACRRPSRTPVSRSLWMPILSCGLPANTKSWSPSRKGAIGGFGAQVLQLLSERGALDRGLKVRCMMLPDIFIDHDSPAAMYAKAGLDAKGVVAKVFEALGKDVQLDTGCQLCLSGPSGGVNSVGRLRMKVILAQPRGFCAGVVRAIEIVERALEKYGPPVYVRHEIVHNKHVVESLRPRARTSSRICPRCPPTRLPSSAHTALRENLEMKRPRGLARARRHLSARHQGA